MRPDSIIILAALIGVGAAVIVGMRNVTADILRAAFPQLFKRFRGRDLMHNEPAVQDLIRRAVAADRSARSRKGWQTRKDAEARRAQQDRDIQTLLKMPTDNEVNHG
jgi:hypothetical protein